MCTNYICIAKKRKCRLLIYDILLIKNCICTSEKIKPVAERKSHLRNNEMRSTFHVFSSLPSSRLPLSTYQLLNHFRSMLLYSFQSQENGGSLKVSSSFTNYLFKTYQFASHPGTKDILVRTRTKTFEIQDWRAVLSDAMQDCNGKRKPERRSVYDEMGGWTAISKRTVAAECLGTGKWRQLVQGSREDLSLNLHLPTPNQAHVYYHLKMPSILFAITRACSHLVAHFRTDWSQSAVKIQSALTLKGIDKRAKSVKLWELDDCVFIFYSACMDSLFCGFDLLPSH